MQKTLITSIIFSIFWINAMAQNNTQSPYSKLGLGDFQNSSFGRTSSMGGYGYALSPSSEVNLQNPASLGNLDSMLSVLSVGVQGQYTHLENQMASDSRWTANLTNLSYGLGVSSKLGLAFGLSPYTNVGYSIMVEQQVNGGNDTYNVLLEGSGGLSSAYVSAGYKLTDNISIGLNVGFYFGPKNETQTYLFSNVNGLDLTKEISDRYNGWIFDLGYQHIIPINKQNKLKLGAVVNLPAKLNHTQVNSAMVYYTTTSTTDSLLNEEENAGDITFPMNVGVGLAYQYKNKLTINADYSLKRWSNAKVDDEFSELIDNHILAFGLEYVPLLNSFEGHEFKYRLGANIQSGYYEIESRKLNSINLTAGVGFKMRNTTFNIYSIYGWRGFTDSNYIKENTLQFGLSMSFGDLWFQKRKYK